MAEPPDIFAKLRLRPGQLRSVAERRLADAKCLLESGDAGRVNGAMYLAGFVIECLLKALLLERHPNLSRPLDAAKLSALDRDVLALLYRHELDEMLAFLPEVEPKLRGVRTPDGTAVWVAFRAICEEWTVYARYSTAIAKPEQGRRYVDTVDEVRKWLKEL